jgi:hypothetical protein
VFAIENGTVKRHQISQNKLIIDADLRKLTQLLFGYHTSKEKAPFPSLFPEKTPVMNFMLE